MFFFWMYSFRRVILENAAVRAAAVPALAKFAARLPSLRPSIRVLIKRSLLDEDDEVNERNSSCPRLFVRGVVVYSWSCMP